MSLFTPPATRKQRAYITVLLDKEQIGWEEALDCAESEGVEAFDENDPDLNIEQASELIDYLVNR